MSEATPGPVDDLAALEARFAALLAPERGGHPDNIPDFQAQIASPSVVALLWQELRLQVQLLEPDPANAHAWARLERIEDITSKAMMLAHMARQKVGDLLVEAAEEFRAIMLAAKQARHRLRPNETDSRRDRVVAIMDSNGNSVELPTRPGPFTIGGPGADVVIAGQVGILAVGEIQPDGRVRMRTLEHTGGVVGRNEPCPCGSGRKFKRCCLN